MRKTANEKLSFRGETALRYALFENILGFLAYRSVAVVF